MSDIKEQIQKVKKKSIRGSVVLIIIKRKNEVHKLLSCSAYSGL